MLSKWVVASWLLLLAPLCSGLYFHIGETERKCFIEELPEETMVIVNYKVELYDPRSQGFMPSTPGIGMHVEVRDPDDKPVLSRVYSSEGRISFTSHVAGEHVICLYSNSSSWFSGAQLRVHLDIQVGEHAIDYAQVAQKEKLSELQLRVRQLLDQVEQITKEQNYQRYREERFRQTSESTNQRVLWWSIGQTAILLVMGAWQMRHLKSFFEAKKLVLRGLFKSYLDHSISASDILSVQSLTEPAKCNDPMANNKGAEPTDDSNRELVEVEDTGTLSMDCIRKFCSGCVPCSAAEGSIIRFLSSCATREPTISYIEL